jgi:hypothetical protein
MAVVEEQRIQQYFGIVAMIDALGVSNYNIEECKNFIKNLSEINQEKNRFIKSLISSQKDFIAKSPGLTTPEYILKATTNIKTSQFGDTIIIAWPIERQYNLNNLMVTFFATASIVGLMHKGLQLKIPFRGCISVGEFLWEDNDAKILGPAIADANNWYTSADWFGVIFSPKATFWVSTLLNESSPQDLLTKMLSTFLCSYNVPLKESNNSQKWEEELFVVGWPVIFYYFSPPEISPQQIFYRALFELPMPKGTESKFKNSENFFIWYGKEVYEKYKDQWAKEPRESKIESGKKPAEG